MTAYVELQDLELTYKSSKASMFNTYLLDYCPEYIWAILAESIAPLSQKTIVILYIYH